DVGEVHHLCDLVALLNQNATQEVLKKKGPEVPDVGVVVHRWTAGVHPHLASNQGHELLGLAGHRVVEPKRRHGISRSRATAWAARASPRPIAPMWSVVVAFSPTAAGSAPSASASLRPCSPMSQGSSMPPSPSRRPTTNR